MRLHSLTVQAVGPFAGRHEVDFAGLAAGGIFLLEGPTGAGKSTVIDAIVFALYGKVAGAAASEDRLRSAFAADDTETVVDLVLETGAGVYRVRRTPAYERAKKSGHGRTRQQASVKLWRLAGAVDGPADAAVGEVVSTRLDEVGAELTRIIGLDRTQFVQTMVLPQGEFASFLRADPEQRRGLLQRIFGTEVYERVQQRLVEQGREVQRSVADARTSVHEAVARFVGASGADEEVAADLRTVAAEQPGTVAERVTVHAEGLAGVADGLTALARDAAARATAVHEHAMTAADVLRRARRRRALLDERDALLSRAEAHAADLERLGRARRATVVRPVLRGLDEARGALAGAEKELTAVLDAAPAGLVPVDLTDQDDAGSSRPRTPAEHLGITAVRATVATTRETEAAVVATLSRLVALEDALPRRARELERLRATVAEQVAALEALDAELADRPADRAALADAFEVAGAAAGRVAAHRHEVAAAEAVLGAVRDLAVAEDEHAAAVTRREEQAAAALDAVRTEAALRAARLEGFAGELAGRLVAGDPCPVCGSTEHPHVADLAPDHVGQDDVDAAEAYRRTAEDRVAAAEAAVATLVERCAALVLRTEGLDTEAAEARVVTCRAGLASAARAEAERDRLRTTLVAHDRETESLRTRRTGLDEQRQAAEGRRDRVERDLVRDRHEIEAARDGHPTVAARQGVAQSRVDAADALVAALDRRTRTSEDVRARAAELAALLVEHGFGSEHEVRGAITEIHGIDAVERAVTEHRTALARVELGLAEEQDAVGGVHGADGAGGADGEGGGAGVDGDGSGPARPSAARPGTELSAADLDALAATAEDLAVAEQEARAVAEREQARHAAARDRSTAAAAAAALVVQACTVLAAQEAAAAPVLRMARLASGADADNSRALSLATYVLVRRFEDVVAAANERLREMSDGRYELERSDEREDVRTRRTGLAMRVLDHTTESTRDPRTLSGGETFYVSLCLALGMADVVTAEAGGIELGTLFVDEGFGSLDPHTLDVVLGELGRLRAGGRVVGVVSHVEALKSAVAERIEVRRRPDGSSTLTVVAG
ncbi:MAG TPA: AAA family ATPase [Cellulomonas sp.]